MTWKQLYAQFDREVASLTREGVTLSNSMTPQVACCVVSCIQLALRHPNNTGPTAAVTRKWCDDVISMVEDVSPDLAVILRMGYASKHDM